MVSFVIFSEAIEPLNKKTLLQIVTRSEKRVYCRGLKQKGSGKGNAVALLVQAQLNTC